MRGTSGVYLLDVPRADKESSQTDAPIGTVQRKSGSSSKKAKAPTAEEFEADAAKATSGQLSPTEINSMLDALDERINDLLSKEDKQSKGIFGSKSKAGDLKAERRKFERIYGSVVVANPDLEVARSKQQASDLYLAAGAAASAAKPDKRGPKAFEHLRPESKTKLGANFTKDLNGKTHQQHIADEAARPGASGAMTAAELMSIFIYTASDYEYINPHVSGGAAFGADWRRDIGKDVDSDAHRKDLADLKAAQKKKGGLDKVDAATRKRWEDAQQRENEADEGRLQGGMLQGALQKLAPTKVKTFRGERVNAGLLAAKKRQWVDGPAATFISTSKSADRAAIFRDPVVKLGEASKPISIWYTLDLFTGRNVEEMSLQQREQEVLIPIGTNLKYTVTQKKLPPADPFWDDREKDKTMPQGPAGKQRPAENPVTERWHVDVKEVPKPSDKKAGTAGRVAPPAVAAPPSAAAMKQPAAPPTGFSAMKPSLPAPPSMAMNAAKLPAPPMVAGKPMLPPQMTGGGMPAPPVAGLSAMKPSLPPGPRRAPAASQTRLPPPPQSPFSRMQPALPAPPTVANFANHNQLPPPPAALAAGSRARLPPPPARGAAPSMAMNAAKLPAPPTKLVAAYANQNQLPSPPDPSWRKKRQF